MPACNLWGTTRGNISEPPSTRLQSMKTQTKRPYFCTIIDAIAVFSLPRYTQVREDVLPLLRVLPSRLRRGRLQHHPRRLQHRLPPINEQPIPSTHSCATSLSPSRSPPAHEDTDLAVHSLMQSPHTQEPQRSRRPPLANNTPSHTLSYLSPCMIPLYHPAPLPQRHCVPYSSLLRAVHGFPDPAFQYLHILS